MEKLCITCALAGAVTTKSQTPYVPDSPEEMAEEARRAYNAGAHMVHVHARDAKGKDRSRVDVLNETIERIRDKCDVLIQIGTGTTNHAGRKETDEERLRLLDLTPKPDVETINAGTFSFYVKSKSAQKTFQDFLFHNPQELMGTFATGMKKRNMGIEFECYDISHIYNVLQLVDIGILARDELNLDFVMGVGGGIAPTPQCLMHLFEQAPPEAHITVMGIGRKQMPLITLGAIMGAGIRVGFEDNVYLEKGVFAKSNGELVEKAVRIMKELGRELATLEEARRILKTPPRQ